MGRHLWFPASGTLVLVAVVLPLLRGYPEAPVQDRAAAKTVLAAGAGGEQNPSAQEISAAEFFTQAAETTKASHFSHSVSVEGRVVDEHGYPLPGVAVTPSGGAGRQTLTDADGHYVISLSAGTPRHRFLASFQASGYREVTASWNLDARSGPYLASDIVLQELGMARAVHGRLTDDLGTPVAGETLHLFSATLNQQLSAISDDAGEFEFPEVFPAEDYRLWVYPVGPYYDSESTMLNLPGEDGWLEVSVPYAGTASIEGRLVNSTGEGLARLAFQLESSDARGQITMLTTDSDGYFTAHNVTPGRFQLVRRAEPFFVASGFEVAEHANLQLEVTVDSGEADFGGRVLNEWGSPVEGAQVLLRWESSSAQGSSRSLRATTTDSEGQFDFSGLDRGNRRLRVAATGFQPREVEVSDQQYQVEIQLYENHQENY